MTPEQFRTLLLQRPFRPFTIRLADGRSFEVAHPEFVAMSPAGRTVIVFDSGDSSGEIYSIIDLLLMSELQVSGANGHSP